MNTHLLSTSSIHRRRASVMLTACAALALAACSAPQKQGVPPAPPSVAAAPAPVPAPARMVQQQPQPQPQPQQAQQPSQQQQQQAVVQALLSRSDATVRMIDENSMDALWASAAPFVATTQQRTQFVAGVRTTRSALGPVQGRSRAGVQGVRVGAESKMPPPGQYANVEYLSQLAGGRKVIEKLSFRQEQDGWRFVGYQTRPVQ